jgi:hypothetical protein
MANATELFAFAGSSYFFLLDCNYLLEVLIFSSCVNELGWNDFWNAQLSEGGWTVEALKIHFRSLRLFELGSLFG